MSNENVFLFYPNLIGYGRIVLAFVAFEGMLVSGGVVYILIDIRRESVNMNEIEFINLEKLTDHSVLKCLLLENRLCKVVFFGLQVDCTNLSINF